MRKQQVIVTTKISNVEKWRKEEKTKEGLEEFNDEFQYAIQKLLCMSDVNIDDEFDDIIESKVCH